MSEPADYKNTLDNKGVFVYYYSCYNLGHVAPSFALIIIRASEGQAVVIRHRLAL